MKILSVLFLVAICTLAVFSSCNNDADPGKNSTLMSEEALSKDGNSGQTPETAPSPAAPEPAQNSAGVWHYTCTKGCAGGSGSASPCATCGATLVHNQSYHGQAPAAAGTPANNTPGASQKPEPPQNAAGIWHYTCTSGCEGGGGSAIICPKCGKQMEHNKAYHQ